MAKLTWVAVLAGASLLAALVAAFAPLAVNTSIITWAPSQGAPTTTPLQLSALAPESMIITIPCDQVRGASANTTTDVVLAWTRVDDLGPSGIGLAAQGDQVWAVNNRAALSSTAMTLPTAQCDLTVAFDRDTSLVKVAAISGTQTLSATEQWLPPSGNLQVPPGAVSMLGAHPSVVPGITVSMTTQPTSVQTQPWRWIASLLAIIFAIMAVWTLTRVPPTTTRNEADDPDESAVPCATRRWAASDTVVGAILAVLVVITPPHYDDGWVLATVRQFKELGFFSNYYWIEAAPQPQGFWWTFLERLWLSPLDTPAFLLRLPAVLLLLWAWWFLRRRVIDQCTSGSRATHCVAATLFILGVGSFLITLRPEPMVALLLVVQLGLIVRLCQRSDPWVFAAIGVIAALAMSLHQSGWAVVAASLAAIPVWFAWVTRVPRRLAIITTLSAIGTTGALFLTLITLGGSFTFWKRGYDAFSADPTYGEGLNESGRLQLLLSSGAAGSALTLFTALAIAIVVISAAVTITRNSRDYLQWACIAAPFGLMLTSSKIQTHVGVIVPAIAVLAATLVARLKPPEKSGKNTLLAIGAALLICTSLAIDQRGLAFALVVATIIIIGLALWLQANFDVSVAVLITAISGAAAIIVVPPLLTTASKPQSWLNQQVNAMQGHGCGLAGDAGLAIPTSVSALQFDSWPQQIVSVPLDIAVSTDQTVPQAGPIAGVPVFTVKGGYSGTVSTPWYTVTDQQELTIWTRGYGLGGGYVDIIFEDSSGGTSSAPRSKVGGDWHVVTTTPPAGTRRLRISWFSSNGPTAVSAPTTTAAHTSVLAAAGQRNLWIAPDRYLEANCVELPSIADGVVSQFNWSIGPPTWFGAIPSAWQVVMACPPEDDQSSRCATRIYWPAQPSYAIETVTRSI